MSYLGTMAAYWPYPLALCLGLILITFAAVRLRRATERRGPWAIALAAGIVVALGAVYLLSLIIGGCC